MSNTVSDRFKLAARREEESKQQHRGANFDHGVGVAATSEHVVCGVPQGVDLKTNMERIVNRAKRSTGGIFLTSTET